MDAIESREAREKFLKNVKRIVCGERDELRGNPEDNFALAWELWEPIVFAQNLSGAEKVAICLAQLKVARMVTGKADADNALDFCGYAACLGGMVSGADGEQPEKEHTCITCNHFDWCCIVPNCKIIHHEMHDDDSCFRWEAKEDAR